MFFQKLYSPVLVGNFVYVKTTIQIVLNKKSEVLNELCSKCIPLKRTYRTYYLWKALTSSKVHICVKLRVKLEFSMRTN